MKKIYTMAAMLFITLQSMADGPGARFSIQQYFPAHLIIEIDGYRYFKHRDEMLTAPIHTGYHQIRVYSYHPRTGLWGMIEGGVIGRNLFRGDFFANPYDDILIRIDAWGDVDIDRYRGDYGFYNRRWNDHDRRWEFFGDRRVNHDMDRYRDRYRYNDRDNDRHRDNRNEGAWNRGDNDRNRDRERNDPPQWGKKDNENRRGDDRVKEGEKGKEPERIQRPDRNPEPRQEGGNAGTPRKGRG